MQRRESTAAQGPNRACYFTGIHIEYICVEPLPSEARVATGQKLNHTEISGSTQYFGAIFGACAVLRSIKAPWRSHVFM